MIIRYLLFCFYFSFIFCKFDNNYLLQERNKVIDLFYHGYNNYMENAFPFDELCPISCSGHNTLGNYSLTLIDSLDMLAIIGDIKEFEKQIKWIQNENYSFNINVNVSTFETNIRILGGLLSSHLLAEDLLNNYPWNNKSLLDYAIEIGDILVKAFDTPTGIPYGTVNLQNGGSIPPNETTITSLATAGTFSLEFGILTRLTGNKSYEYFALRAVEAVWNARSSYKLLGNHINIDTGEWVSLGSSIGGNTDSFYEYLLKNSILFGNNRQREIFNDAYTAIMKHIYKRPWYTTVDMRNAKLTAATFESLQAFWPGLQVLLGDIEEASQTMHEFQSIWQEFGFVPELYDLTKNTLSKGRDQYPLRPEMAESLYYLYSATKDPIYLQYGSEMIHSINKYARVNCGIAAINSIITKDLRDHMDSFFLSETCKYLYLLFTPNHPITRTQKYVFNTEGHPFPIKYEWLYDKNNIAKGECTNPLLPISLSYYQFQPNYHNLKRNDDIALEKLKKDSLNQLKTQENLSNTQSQLEKINDNTSDNTNDNTQDSISNSKDNSNTLTDIISTTEKLVSLEIIYPPSIDDNDNEVHVMLSQFGPSELKTDIIGTVIEVIPNNACDTIVNFDIQDKIALVERGECEFVYKVRMCQEAGAIAVIVVNNIPTENFASISMSGDGDDIIIPSIFVSHKFGRKLYNYLTEDILEVKLSSYILNEEVEPIIIDLSKFDMSNPTEAQNYLSSIFGSLQIENSEKLSQQLSALATDIKYNSNSNSDDIHLELGSLESYQEPGKIVGKKFQACIDGEC